jgi:hypothetical protein
MDRRNEDDDDEFKWGQGNRSRRNLERYLKTVERLYWEEQGPLSMLYLRVARPASQDKKRKPLRGRKDEERADEMRIKFDWTNWGRVG